MSTSLTDTALLVAAVSAGLSGGMVLAFSNFIMRALNRLEHDEAIRAMQSINETVLNPLFLAVFIGLGVMMLAIAVVCVALDGWSPHRWLVTGASLYFVGVVAVTAARNVPLNEGLASVHSASASAETWATYSAHWTQWNHVRSVAATAASAAFILART